MCKVDLNCLLLSLPWYIDVEFVDVFILTFHSFMTPMQLMKALIER